MSGLDVEALLDSTAKGLESSKSSKTPEPSKSDHDDRHKSDRRDRRDRDREHDDERTHYRKRSERSRERSKRDRDADGDEKMRSPRSDRGSAAGSLKSSRRRSTSRDSDRRHRRDRTRESVDPEDAYRASGGDYYRGGGRPRTRSRSPDGDRSYRPSNRGGRRDRDDRDARVDERDRYRDRERDRGRGGRDRDERRVSDRRDRSRSKEQKPAPLTEDERDRRTVFVQQLAARLRTKELIEFFEKVGPVNEAQIVKDRVSGRSKGVGYVEFKNEESVSAAIALTGQKLLGIPIIAQLTEAEKNRQARNPEGGASGNSGVPFHRLYVGNIHFSITEDDLKNVFEPFGELELVQLQKEEQGRSRGYGFVQFRDPNQAKDALEKMNGFDLAGRPIRVGLGNDKFTDQSTQNLLQRFNGQAQPGFQGSAFSGHGGRGANAGGSGGNFDRAGGRDNDKGAGGASALDDTDVGGVNFNNYSRDSLMRKLARVEDPEPDKRQSAKPNSAKTAPVNMPQASRCVVLRNMFNPDTEEGDDWIKELEEDVKQECEDKYGHVVHLAVDPNTQGDVYVKFDRIEGGENAMKGLNGRYFGGNMITVQPVVDAVYRSLFAHAF